MLASRRGYLIVLVAGLASTGAVVVGSSRPWVRATATIANMPEVVAEVNGTDVVPASAALGLAGLAAFGAVVATRGWARVLVGAVIAVGMTVLLLVTLWPPSTTEAVEDALAARGWAGGDYATTVVAWRWLVAVAAAVAAGCGVAVLRYGRRWATMGERYDAPVAPSTPATPTHEADVWRAIDRGADPTDDG
jgi:uncharacterized membrane protein (TIGR02234 family)